MADSPPRRTGFDAPIPRLVWTLGFVSLFMDVASEIVHGLLPIYLTTTLGASVVFVGIIDGIAESTASIVKVFSGYLSDRIGRRRPLILLGYGLAAISKPLFPAAEGVPLVLGARLADRIGKGLRGAPRDALVADVTPAPILGRAYGLRQALDTVGAVVGPLLAIALMLLLANDIRAVLWIAVIPAALATLLVWVGVRDPARVRKTTGTRPTIHFKDIAGLSRPFWDVVVIGVVFTLARFSEAFLILKASAVGLAPALTPLVLVVMSLVYALGAYPAGVLSDRVAARKLFSLGVVLLVAADIVLVFSSTVVSAFFGIALWGGHMAVTQGLLAKLVAERVPETLRGTGFGVFNLATGVALLLASLAAGLLWDHVGPVATFVAGAGFAAMAGAMTLGRLRSIGA